METEIIAAIAKLTSLRILEIGKLGEVECVQEFTETEIIAAIASHQFADFKKPANLVE